MEKFTLTATTQNVTPRPDVIYCPSLAGLTPAQADLAFVMPRMDHNRAVRENARQGDWAALLASDPFGSEAALLTQLRDVGYRGVTNWPSSILLDGGLRQAMSTIPASPEFEYAFLGRARDAGLETMAFFRSLEQARAALSAGLRQLVLHPGLLEIDSTETGQRIAGSLTRLVDTIKNEAADATVFAYTSDWHEGLLRLSALPVDGHVWLEDTA